MKKCIRCNIEKEISEFNKHNGKKDKLQIYCRDCNNKLRRDYYKNNPNKIRNDAVLRRELLKNKFKEYKSNLICSKCGENHPACLDFHHRNPNEKIMDVGHMVFGGYSFENIKKEIEKCIVLCSNCHRKLHYEEKLIMAHSSNGSKDT